MNCISKLILVKVNPCSSLVSRVNQLQAPFSFAWVTTLFVSGSKFVWISDYLLVSCSVFLCVIILVTSFISAVFNRLVPWVMIRPATFVCLLFITFECFFKLINFISIWKLVTNIRLWICIPYLLNVIFGFSRLEL